jgi:sec-independent protein translocase protein TatA
VGYQELLIVLVIVLVLFGGAKLPQLMRGVGQGIREFKEGVDEGKKSPAPSEDKPASLKE